MIGSSRFTRPRRAVAGLALLFGLAATLLGSGCEQGQPPYDVIARSGNPDDFLPPGVQIGTLAPTTGRIYHFDRSRYRLFKPTAGTEPKYVRRDSVLALAEAGNPGMNTDLLRHPDRYDSVRCGDQWCYPLKEVYATPDLYGFEPTESGQVGFQAGRTIARIADYFPIQQGNRWQFDHNQREWSFTDSIGGVSSPPTGAGQPVVKMWTTCQVNPTSGTLLSQYVPNQYRYDTDLSVGADGITWHAWRTIAERVVLPEARVPPGPNGQPDRQRNPRPLWLSITTSADPQAPVPVTIDQCLDDLPAALQLFPLRFCGGAVQEGQKYTTWTYLDVDTDSVRARLNSEKLLPRGGRCGVDLVVEADTLRLLPTRSYRVLARFDVECERIVDQVELKVGDFTIGKYPRVAAANSIVKFRATMNVSAFGPSTTPVQLFDLWYQKDLGPVIRTQGVDPSRRSNARLATCTVGGVPYRGDDPAGPFEYRTP